MNIQIHKDVHELSQQVAVWMSNYITETLARKDRFSIALSGGSTPQKLHAVLAASPFREKIDWSKIHFFWGDERAVPFDDERNNAKMAFDTLLDKVPVNKEHIHIMRTDIAPEAAAHEYETLLHQYFDKQDGSFDLVLLGMGDDGHTLSLFPGTEIIHEEKAWVKAFYLSAQSMYRISLTASVTNLSHAVAFLVTGKNKADTLKQVIKGPYQPSVFPSQLIKPTRGELHWFLDEAAAAALNH